MAGALRVVGWVVLALAAIQIFVGPFTIGQESKASTARQYILGLIVSACNVLVAGHAIGWW